MRLHVDSSRPPADIFWVVWHCTSCTDVVVLELAMRLVTAFLVGHSFAELRALGYEQSAIDTALRTHFHLLKKDDVLGPEICRVIAERRGP
jgi:hypothetical protein